MAASKENHNPDRDEDAEDFELRPLKHKSRYKQPASNDVGKLNYWLARAFNKTVWLLKSEGTMESYPPKTIHLIICWLIANDAGEKPGRRAASVPKSTYLRRFTCPLNNAHQAQVILFDAFYSARVAAYTVKP